MVDHIHLLIVTCETAQAEIETAKATREHAQQAIAKSRAIHLRAHETLIAARAIAACSQSLREAGKKTCDTPQQFVQEAMPT